MVLSLGRMWLGLLPQGHSAISRDVFGGHFEAGTGFRRQEPGMLLGAQAALLQSSASSMPIPQAQHLDAGQPGSPPRWALKGGAAKPLLGFQVS